MRSSHKRYFFYFISALVVIFLIGWGIYYGLPPQESLLKELTAPALSPQSVWDQKFLTRHSTLREKITRFEKGELCKSLQEIDTRNLTHRQITEELHKRGFRCSVRPLNVSSRDPSQGYLKIDNSITQNPQDKGVAYQEICQDPHQPECVMRIKRDGFPRNRRSIPHSSKAVLMNSTRDPGSYENEAFKIGAHGQPLPKGPSRKFGLKKCPYHKDQHACNQWVDKVMEEVHPPLKEPQRTP